MTYKRPTPPGVGRIMYLTGEKEPAKMRWRRDPVGHHRKFALVLYPITPYTDQELRASHRVPLRDRARLRDTFDCALTKRFRQRGWRVVWVLFARDDDVGAPDTSLLSPFFTIHDADAFVVAPVSFATHCREERYPSPQSLLEPLGKIERLAVCGFHCTDCVDRIARHAHRRGIPVKVHEELTDRFFALDTWRRTNAQPRAIIKRTMPVDPVINSRASLRSLVENERRDRRRKPWLMQWA